MGSWITESCARKQVMAVLIVYPTSSYYCYIVALIFHWGRGGVGMRRANARAAICSAPPLCSYPPRNLYLISLHVSACTRSNLAREKIFTNVTRLLLVERNCPIALHERGRLYLSLFPSYPQIFSFGAAPGEKQARRTAQVWHVPLKCHHLEEQAVNSGC